MSGTIENEVGEVAEIVSWILVRGILLQEKFQGREYV